MKFWQPSRISSARLILVSLLSLGLWAGTEWVQRQKRTSGPVSKESLVAMKEAAKLNEAALQFLANERVKRGLPVDARVDPARGGMVGLAMSPISSRVGSLPAKRTTRDPNWSAFIVSMLVEAGVKAGDFVAVGMSG